MFDHKSDKIATIFHHITDDNRRENFHTSLPNTDLRQLKSEQQLLPIVSNNRRFYCHA